MAEPSTQRRTIGDILLSHGYVTEDQLEQAAEEQRRTGKPLGQVLVEAGQITRLELASALAEQWSDSSEWMNAPRDAEGSGSLTNLLSGPVTREGSGPARPGRAPEDGLLAARVAALEAAVQEVLRSDADASAATLESAVADLARRIAAWDHVLAELESRVDRSVESGVLEERLAGLVSRIDAALADSEEAGAAAAAAAARVDELGAALAGSVADLERVSGATAAELTSVAAQLERALDTAVTSELRAAVAELAERPPGDPALAGQIEQLAARVEELAAGVEELTARPVGDPALAEHVAGLAAHIEEVASRPAADPALGERLDRLAAEVGALADDAPLEELRASVAQLAARPTGDAELAGRVEDLSRRVDALVVEAGARAGAAEIPDELRVAIEELAGRPPADAALASRVDELAARVAALPGPDALDELRIATTELAERVAALPGPDALAELAAQVAALPGSHAVEDLRAAVAELAGRPASDPTLAERVDALAGRLDALADASALEEVRDAVGALAERPAGDPAVAERLEAVAARVEELAAAVRQAADDAPRRDEAAAALHARLEADSSFAAERLDALATRLDGLDEAVAVAAESRAATEPDAARDGGERAELEARIASVAGTAEGLTGALAQAVEGWESARTALEARLDELAGRLASEGAPAQPSEAPPAAPVPAPVSQTIEQEVERTLMAVERLGLHLGEHDRALAELMRAHGASSRLDELAARVDELEAYGPAPHAPGAEGEASAGGPPHETREIRTELRALARKLSEMEEASRVDREKLLTMLERMASSIDWRVRRLESGEGATGSSP